MFTETLIFRYSYDFLFRNCIAAVHLKIVNNCSTLLFFLCLHSSSSEMKINKQTLDPTTTPMTRREEESAETGEHKHAELLASDILYDITKVN